MEEKEIKEYYQFFCEAWKFFKKYADRDMDEVFWPDMVKEAEDMMKRYGNTEFVTRILSQVVLEMERKRRKE